DGPSTRDHEQPLGLTALGQAGGARAISQQLLQNPQLSAAERACQIGKMDEMRRKAGHRRLQGGDAGEDLLDAKAGKRRGAREYQQTLCHYFFSPGDGEYIGIGNCATLAPPSSAVILLTPCFLTSSIRSTECSGRKVRFTPINSLLMRSSAGSRTTEERSPKTSSSTSMNPNRSPCPTLRA